jgi:hypothetical protein
VIRSNGQTPKEESTHPPSSSLLTIRKKKTLEKKPRKKEEANWVGFIGLAYQGKKDIVFRFIIEYSTLRDFGP